MGILDDLFGISRPVTPIISNLEARRPERLFWDTEVAEIIVVRDGNTSSNRFCATSSATSIAGSRLPKRNPIPPLSGSGKDGLPVPTEESALGSSVPRLQQATPRPDLGVPETAGTTPPPGIPLLGVSPPTHPGTPNSTAPTPQIAGHPATGSAVPRAPPTPTFHDAAPSFGQIPPPAAPSPPFPVPPPNFPYYGTGQTTGPVMPSGFPAPAFGGPPAISGLSPSAPWPTAGPAPVLLPPGPEATISGPYPPTPYYHPSPVQPPVLYGSGASPIANLRPPNVLNSAVRLQQNPPSGQAASVSSAAATPKLPRLLGPECVALEAISLSRPDEPDVAARILIVVGDDSLGSSLAIWVGEKSNRAVDTEQRLGFTKDSFLKFVKAHTEGDAYLQQELVGSGCDVFFVDWWRRVAQGADHYRIQQKLLRKKPWSLTTDINPARYHLDHEVYSRWPSRPHRPYHALSPPGSSSIGRKAYHTAQECMSFYCETIDGIPTGKYQFRT